VVDIPNVLKPIEDDAPQAINDSTNVRARINGETAIVASHVQLKEAESIESVCESSVQAMINHCEKTMTESRADLE
jgi:hypothetical protein